MESYRIKYCVSQFPLSLRLLITVWFSCPVGAWTTPIYSFNFNFNHEGSVKTLSVWWSTTHTWQGRHPSNYAYTPVVVSAIPEIWRYSHNPRNCPKSRRVNRFFWEARWLFENLVFLSWKEIPFFRQLIFSYAMAGYEYVHDVYYGAHRSSNWFFVIGYGCTRRQGRIS